MKDGDTYVLGKLSDRALTSWRVAISGYPLPYFPISKFGLASEGVGERTVMTTPRRANAACLVIPSRARVWNTACDKDESIQAKQR